MIKYTNGFGKVYHTIEYVPRQWVYSNWIGYQTFTVASYRAPIRTCIAPRTTIGTLLLNDSREVVGPWATP
jgi:hypothetical protein